MKAIFFGTSSFAAEILDFLVKEKFFIEAVVTKPDKKRGRAQKNKPTPVKEAAEKFSLPVFQPEKASEDAFVKKLHALEPDLFIVIAYGEIIKQKLLNVPRKGAINVHASLLPKYRGAAPIRRALLNGDDKTGISIIEMTAEMDAGDILGEEVIYVPDSMTFGELEKEMIQATKRLLPQILEELDKGIIKKTPQKFSDATFAKKIEKEELQIRWERSASEIHNQIRAFSPYPGAWTEVLLNGQKKRLKILKSEVKPIFHKSPGEILAYNQNEFTISAKEGAVSVLELQLEGKKAMAFDQLARGFPNLDLF
ncbi:MAG: methionyl-tRNA formyltransferase [Simkaniaceae bacterium]